MEQTILWPNVVISDGADDIDFRIVSEPNSVSCIGIIGIDGDYYEYELYEYGGEIFDPYWALYYSTDKTSITAYDPTTLRVVFKFIFENRGDLIISFAYIDINEISDDSPMYIHKQAHLEICPKKFTRAWNDITRVDDCNYLYKCSDNNMTYRFKYDDDNIHLSELFCLTGSWTE